VYIDPGLIQYAVRLVAATREPARFGLDSLKGMLTYGASPRASISLIEAARALALIRGRNYMLAQDVVALAPDVMRHRMTLSYEALSQGKTADGLIAEVMKTVAAPEQPLSATGS
jgi:MoxR-like ATPase